jgi:hypothetical protein
MRIIFEVKNNEAGIDSNRPTVFFHNTRIGMPTRAMICVKYGDLVIAF